MESGMERQRVTQSSSVCSGFPGGVRAAARPESESGER